MEKITKEQWGEFVKKNSDNSYSFVVCLAILNLWEAGVKTQEEAGKVLMSEEMGLSGAQAQMAINYVLSHDAEDWLDKEMVEVSRTEETAPKITL